VPLSFPAPLRSVDGVTLQATGGVVSVKAAGLTADLFAEGVGVVARIMRGTAAGAESGAEGLVHTAGTTSNHNPFYGRLIDVAFSEANAQCRVPRALTIIGGAIEVSANTTTAGSTFRVRNNGGNGNLTVTIGAGLTGVFTLAGAVDDIAAGNPCALRVIVGTGGNLTVRSVSLFYRWT